MEFFDLCTSRVAACIEQIRCTAHVAVRGLVTFANCDFRNARINSFWTTLSLVMCLFWLGCNKFNNSLEEIRIQCGSEIDLVGYSVIKIGDNSYKNFSAVIESEGQYTSASISSRACIKIPNDLKEPSSLFVRSNVDAKGFVIQLSEQLKPYTLVGGLEAKDEVLRKSKSSFICLTDAAVINEKLPIARIDQASNFLSFSAFQFEINDASGNTLERGKLDRDTTALQIPSSAPDGTYTIRLISKDIFEPNTEPLQSYCSFTLDRNAPNASSNLADKDILLDTNGAKKVAPAEVIVFTKDKDSGTRYFVCAKQREDQRIPQTCNATEYAERDSITAAGNGVWDLSYYAVDRAGNQSPVNHEVFAIYNQLSIDQVLTQITVAQLNNALGKQKPSLQSIETAAGTIDAYDLPSERAAVRWPFLETFWNLDQKLTFVADIQEKVAIRNLVVSPSGRQFITLLADGSARLYQGNTKLSEISGVKLAAFLNDDRLWVYNDRQELQLLESGKPVYSQPLNDVEPTQLAVAPSGLAAVLWNESKAVIVNRSLTQQALSVIELPSPSMYRNRFQFNRDGNYLIWRNGSRISVFSMTEQVPPLVQNEATGCVIREFALRGNDEIYLISRWNRFLGPPPPEDTFPCGLKKIKVLGSTLETTPLMHLYPKNFVHLAHLSISKDPEESILLIGDEASSLYYRFDLLEDQQPAVPQTTLPRGDSLTSISSFDSEKPAFLIRSQSQMNLDVEISGRLKTIFREPNESGNCMPQNLAKLLYCFDGGKGQEIRIYSISRSKSLQDNMFLEFDQVSESVTTGPQLVDISPDLRYILFGQETQKNVILKKRSGELVISKELESPPLNVSVGLGGYSAVVLETGKIGVFSPDLDLVWAESVVEGSIIQLKQAGNRTLALVRRSMDLQLVSWIRSQDRLIIENSITFDNPNVYDAMSLSYDAEFLALYQDGRGKAINQLIPVIRAADFDSIRTLEARAAKVEWQASSNFLYYPKERSIRRFDATTGDDSLVMDDLAFQPRFAMATSRLFAIDEDSLLWDLELKRSLLESVLNLSEGPNETLLIKSSKGNIQVIDASTGTNVATVQLSGQTNALRFFFMPKSSDFAYLYYEPFVGYGARFMTTDLKKVKEMIDAWPKFDGI